MTAKRIIRKVLLTLAPFIDDKTFLKLRYRLEMGVPLDLRNPKTMNEKLQWLKLYNRKPEYTNLVDKITVKDIVGEIIGKEYINPTLEIWNSVNDINFDVLPEKFVMKTNHSGGNTGVVICRDKNKLDKELTISKLANSLSKHNIYRDFREWPYKNIKPKIFVEPLLESKEDPKVELTDYKFFCFDGNVDSVMICVDRQIGSPKFYFFDKDWQLRRYNKRGKEAPADFTLPKPKNLDKMYEIASTLSKGLPFMRVDLYNVDGNIYFGELTFFPASGFDYNMLHESDVYFGNLIKLPQNRIEE